MKILNSVLMTLALVVWSSAMANERSSPRDLNECNVDEEVVLQDSENGQYLDFEIEDAEGECGRRPTDEYVFQLIVNEAGLFTFSLDEFEAQGWMYILTGCCDGEQLFPRGLVEDYSYLRCIWLTPGTYYLLIEGEQGDYVLGIESCDHPCTSVPFEDGFTYEGNSIVFVETVDASSSEPNYGGPWQTDGVPCQDESANPESEWRGFGYYNWYNQDFGWTHLFDLEGNTCADYSIDSAFVVVCAYEIDYNQGEGQGNPARDASYCQWDYLSAIEGDGPLGILNWDASPGSNLSVSETRLWIPTQFLEDGQVDFWLDIDAMSTTCAWATEVWSSKLIVYMSCRQIPPTPDGYDLGDLPSLSGQEQPCYPTYTPESGGPANAVYASENQVAWLGECVTHELSPLMPDFDACDDGIFFVPGNHPDGAWMPGDEVCVDVTITTGPAYVQGTPLFVWGWKDGNLDCDFDDILSPEEGDEISECIIPGEMVFPGGPNMTFTQRFCFLDPGVLDMGRYDGHFRFRLLSAGGEIPSRNGQYLDCSSAQTFVDEVLGETEDYIVEDFQLPVELLSFTANGQNGRVVLSWTTATENENDAFEVQRWEGSGWRRAGDLVDGAGTSARQRSYQFVDHNVTAGQTYRYSLITIDMRGNRVVVGEVESLVEPLNAVVVEFALHQNFPNPFNPSTQISYDLAQAANVNLAVFDLLGRQVATLVNGSQQAGRYSVNFDATMLPSGMYFYRLETEQFTDIRKMMLLK